MEFKVSIIKFFHNVLEGFLEELSATAILPIADHLFQIHNKKEAKFLMKKEAQEFHHVDSQLLRPLFTDPGQLRIMKPIPEVTAFH